MKKRILDGVELSDIDPRALRMDINDVDRRMLVNRHPTLWWKNLIEDPLYVDDAVRMIMDHLGMKFDFTKSNFTIQPKDKDDE